MKIKNVFANLKFLVNNFIPIVSLSKEKQIADILIKNNLKLCMAESCTGGLLSSRLTDIAGSSNYTFQNFTTYANDAKERILGVNRKSIIENGVVSYEVSLEMTKGLLKKYNCDIAVSTTGIAGPTGGSGEKPLGLVYITAGSKEKQKTYKYEADTNLSRRFMKYAFSQRALEILLNFLKENYD